MAQSTEKSKILAKLKKSSKGAYKRSKTKDAKAKGSRLPDGIVNGVAQLSSYKMALDKKSNPYFTISGIGKEPPECKGARVTVMHFIKDTQMKTVEDKLDALCSDIKLLGGELEGTEIDDLPDILEGLCGEGPHFLFNTWKPPADDRNPNPDTLVFIQGLAEGYEGNEEPEVEVDDDDADDDDDTSDDDEDLEDTSDDDVTDDSEADDDADDSDWSPSKGEIYLYRASSRVKPKDFEVTSINKGNKTVSLKGVASPNKVHKDVTWDRLESEDD